MEESKYVFLIVQRVLDQFHLISEVLQAGGNNPNSESSKWRLCLEKLLKKAITEIINSGTISSIPLSDFLKQCEKEEELGRCKHNRLRDLSIRIQTLEKSIAVSRTKQKSEVQMLNQEISILKDELDRQIEQSSQKLDHCRKHEEELVHNYHASFHNTVDTWNHKIQDLEQEIEQEIQRNGEVERTLCASIEEIQQETDHLRKAWKEAIADMEAESKVLLEHRAQTSSRTKESSEKLKERKFVVEEHQRAKWLEQEEQKRVMQYTVSVIRIQAWWRGVLARKDYQRYKMLMRAKNTKGRGNRNSRARGGKNERNLLPP